MLWLFTHFGVEKGGFNGGASVSCAVPLRSHELGEIFLVLGTGFGLREDVGWMLGVFEM